MGLINNLRARYNLTVLMVTHDMEMAAYADRVLTLRDGALGQDLTHVDEQKPSLDDAGRITLPEAVRSQLSDAPRIAVEIRPEGVLLRPETEEEDDTQAMLEEMLPQDTPPESRRWRLFRRRKRSKA
jgi:energy-coupling factor transporter ATP-binding protein EcfA2